MEKITVKKKTLLAKVKANRDEHRRIYEQAREGYRLKAILGFERQITKAKAGKRFDTRLPLVEPEDHTNDYDRVIAMLELSVGDKITVSERDFLRYVRNEWEWERSFQHSVNEYLN